MACTIVHAAQRHIDAAVAADDFDDRRVVAAIDSLLGDDDDDDVPPPPPPPHSDDDEEEEDNGGEQSGSSGSSLVDNTRCLSATDCDAAASARSSPDDNYSSGDNTVAPAAAAGFATDAAEVPSPPSFVFPEAGAKTFVPFGAFFGAPSASDDAADAAALEELEARSARNDDDDASYHGGGTTDGDDDDAPLSEHATSPLRRGLLHNHHDDDFDLLNTDGGESDFDIHFSDGAPAAAADDDEEDEEVDFDVDGEDGDEEGAACSSSYTAHPFLDLDLQRRQVDWDKSQLRASYHGEMQRTVTLGHEDRVVALRALMNEADRYHRRHAASSGANTMSAEEWSALAHEAAEDLVLNGPPSVQRNLSCMCIFSLDTAAREYGEHEEERARRAATQHRSLQALRLQAMRGGSPYFLRPSTPFYGVDAL